MFALELTFRAVRKQQKCRNKFNQVLLLKLDAFDNTPKSKLLEWNKKFQFVLALRISKKESLHIGSGFFSTSILKFNRIAESLNRSTVVHQSVFFLFRQNFFWWQIANFKCNIFLSFPMGKSGKLLSKLNDKHCCGLSNIIIVLMFTTFCWFSVIFLHGWLKLVLVGYYAAKLLMTFLKFFAHDISWHIY